MHQIVNYSVLNRSFILEWDKLEDVKICDFKLENDKHYTPAVNIKIQNTWITILAKDNDERREIEKELRKIIMKGKHYGK